MSAVEIVGRGFLARHLSALAGAHEDVTVLAAGVSSTAVASPDALAREAALVRDTARRCGAEGRTLVFLSTASQALYGTCDTPAGEESAAPVTPYGRHKLDLERRLAQDLADSDASWLVLRLSHVVGSHQRPHQLLPALVAQIASGEVRVFAGAHRDLVDVADVVACLDALLASGTRREVLNVAAGTPYAVEDIVRGVERQLGRTARWDVVDAGDRGGRTTVRVDRLRHHVGDHAPAGGPAYLERLLVRYTASYRPAALV
ncbi:NAD-dependent epimerase/dehydratase family protein [Streptomyces sp. DG2A-72]|uniref:NAD-dependent epimerase/dehydratase family protein n=1 Tax=Streptomyces sp. DG2A-72 TaxID=3051386 RepID=UPI00265C13C7|nr:NAD-dependent epimerase/dehydratase family protein [Streptomyces sp. DG2A-72]MDO0938365.1 NAD-dependent epimerase/dehydratase family protein [Streptomyces sp. DG2A-72]